MCKYKKGVSSPMHTEPYKVSCHTLRQNQSCNIQQSCVYKSKVSIRMSLS